MKYKTGNWKKGRRCVRLQTQAASQKSVNKPSDDPVGTTKLLSSRTESKGIEQYTKNLDIAGEFLNFTDQSLDEVTQIFMRAKELALAGQ